MDADLFFTLACIGPTPVAYLTSYSFQIPDNVNTYIFGIWDNANEKYLENHEHLYHSPTITDDGSGIYITNTAELRQILDTMTYAAKDLEPDQYLISGMWESDSDADLDLWSEFDPAGIDDALLYLVLFHRHFHLNINDPPNQRGPTVLRRSPRRWAWSDLRRRPGTTGRSGSHSGSNECLWDRFGVMVAATWPLYALSQHRWIYESDYYRSLLEKARLTNPTELVSSGERIILQHTCIHTQWLWCKHLNAYFVPNVERRTEGQVTINVTSFPELGLAGGDTATLLADGTLSMAEVYGGYLTREFPILEMQYLWGLWPDHHTHFTLQASMSDDLDRIISQGMDSQVLMRNWIAGDDQFIFSDQRLNSVLDFRGLDTRSHSARLSDWLNGMGAEARFMAFSEVYGALERGNLDAAVTGAVPGLSQRWYEVINYMNGPLISFNSTTNAIGRDVWNAIPRDLQQILIEEGAKHELEALRLAAIQNITGSQGNIDAGLVLVEFSSGIRQQGFIAGYSEVVPGWLRQLGYPGDGDETVALFNEHAGPRVGLRIEPDGSVAIAPITAGPHAGKTMEQVLSE